MAFKLKFLFGGGIDETAAREIYDTIVTQARKTGFYNVASVPDTPTGRFAMVTLHGFLALDRLGQQPEARNLAQELFDLMFADMDRNLREMGVGDLSVGKKVKGLAQHFYVMAATFREGMKEGGTALHGPLRQIVYQDCEPSLDAVAALSDYMEASKALLAEQEAADIAKGRIAFAQPPGED